MADAKHTPGPLVLAKHGAIVGGPMREFTNGAAQGQLVMCTNTGTVTGEHAEVLANAARIVQCWNAHDGLVALLEDAIARVERADELGLPIPVAVRKWLEPARAAIAKATESAALPQSGD